MAVYLWSSYIFLTLNKIHNTHTHVLGNILYMSSFVSECSLECSMLLINQVKGRFFTTAFISIYWYLCHRSPANCYGIGGNKLESNEFCLSNETASTLQIPSVLWNSQLWPICVQNLMKSLQYLQESNRFWFLHVIVMPHHCLRVHLEELVTFESQGFMLRLMVCIQSVSNKKSTV